MSGRVWSSSEMILTRGNRSNRRETCPSATSSTINSTLTGLRSKTALRNDKQAPDLPSHGTAVSVFYNDNCRHFKIWSLKFRIRSLETRHRNASATCARQNTLDASFRCGCTRNPSRLGAEYFRLSVQERGFAPCRGCCSWLSGTAGAL